MSKPFQYYLFHKPYGVLSQFTSDEGIRNLSEFNLPKDVYAAGRLDKDSEGLLLLTNDGALIEKMLNPKSLKEKTYWVQVDNDITDDAIKELSLGVQLKDYTTKKAKVKKIPPPNIVERDPPVRFRKNIPTSWIEIKLVEGKNRQIRHMTAKVGFPTLRIIRIGILNLNLGQLNPGGFLEITKDQIQIN